LGERFGERGLECRLACGHELDQRGMRSGRDGHLGRRARRSRNDGLVGLVAPVDGVEGVVDGRMQDGEDARLVERVELLGESGVGRDAIPALHFAGANLGGDEDEGKQEGDEYSVIHDGSVEFLERAA
jgi:hypothetical protein